MSVDIEVEELARRLVIGHKRDGRNVYDPIVKRELIEACMRPGVSVTKVARECGINANQLSTWIRVHQNWASAAVAGGEVFETSKVAFVPMQIQAAPAALEPQVAQLDLQARLPNGVVVDLRGCDLEQAGRMVEALGRLRCSVSTKG